MAERHPSPSSDSLTTLDPELAGQWEREAWMAARGIKKMSKAEKSRRAVPATGTKQERVAAIRRAAQTGRSIERKTK